MSFTATYNTALIGTWHDVNTTVAGNQTSATSVLTAGGTAIFYVDESGAGSILARRADANGVPTGAEIVVATAVDTPAEGAFSVAALTSGDIVVVWSTNLGDINYRLYDSSLTPQGPATLAETNLFTGGRPDVAAMANGGFVIAWEVRYSADEQDIALRRFDALGVSSDPGIGLFTSSAFVDEHASVAVLTNGRIVLAYNTRDTSFGISKVWRKVYNADGTVSSPSFELIDSFAVSRNAEVVATPDGGYRIAYEALVLNNNVNILTSVFNSSSGGVAATHLSSSTATSDQYLNSAVSPDGFLLVGYTQQNDSDVLATLFDPSGQPLTLDMRLIGDGAGSNLSLAGSMSWIDGARILVVSSGDNGAPGDDGGGYGVASTVHYVQRNVVGDIAGDVMNFSLDGLRNIVNAGGGADFITTSSAPDVINGELGDDTIVAGGGDDVVDGGPGADTITGGAGADTINGGDGADTIHGFAGADTVDGGAGLDTIVLTATSTDLNAATNARIVNVEQISAAAAAAGVAVQRLRAIGGAGEAQPRADAAAVRRRRRAVAGEAEMRRALPRGAGDGAAELLQRRVDDIGADRRAGRVGGGNEARIEPGRVAQDLRRRRAAPVAADRRGGEARPGVAAGPGLALEAALRRQQHPAGDVAHDRRQIAGGAQQAFERRREGRGVLLDADRGAAHHGPPRRPSREKTGAPASTLAPPDAAAGDAAPATSRRTMSSATCRSQRSASACAAAMAPFGSARSPHR